MHIDGFYFTQCSKLILKIYIETCGRLCTGTKISNLPELLYRLWRPVWDEVGGGGWDGGDRGLC